MVAWKVWEEVPIEICWKATNKNPLGGRWVDVNKGGSSSPNVRCRYVAKELALTKPDDFAQRCSPLRRCGL